MKKSKKIISFVAGKLSTGKGIDLFSEVVDRFDDRFVFWAVGRDIGKSVNKKIIKFGWLKQNDLFSLMRLSDIVVTPSIHPESFGRVAWDCSFIGTPVVGANVCGLSEVITEHKTGFLFDVDDGADGLYKSIRLALVHNAYEYRDKKDVEDTLNHKNRMLYTGLLKD